MIQGSSLGGLQRGVSRRFPSIFRFDVKLLPWRWVLSEAQGFKGRAGMTSRFLAFGILAVTVSLAAVAAVSTFRHPPLRPSALSGNARLHAFGSRGTGQRQGSAQAKFDGALGDLSRHASNARPDHVLQDLRSMAPAVRFKQKIG